MVDALPKEQLPGIQSQLLDLVSLALAQRPFRDGLPPAYIHSLHKSLSFSTTSFSTRQAYQQQSLGQRVLHSNNLLCQWLPYIMS